MPKQKILIVGGGFAGVRAALEIHKRSAAAVEITLVVTKPHFEYNPALYRYVTGNSSIEVCIPLDVIFKGKAVTLVRDKVTSIDKVAKTALTESGKTFSYDKLILGLGSETTYMGIEGLKENSFGMKTVAEALRLKEHISKTLYELKHHNEANKNIRDLNFVVIGGGATGVELAGRLISYARGLARDINLNPALIQVTIVEYAPSVLFRLSEPFHKRVEAYLRKNGITLLMNTQVKKQDVEELYLNDTQMKTNTVIWTAGVKANELYEKSGFIVNKPGKVEVDEHMYAKGTTDIFIVGDGAQTTYSGYAQTAFYDGRYVARVIEAEINKTTPPVYAAPKPVNAIPAGEKWAGVAIDLWGHEIRFYGRIGWWFRRLADLRSFMVLLPFIQAYKVWIGACVADTCDVCGVETPISHA